MSNFKKIRAAALELLYRDRQTGEINRSIFLFFRCEAPKEDIRMVFRIICMPKVRCGTYTVNKCLN
jgi:hypothetical protein